MHVLIDEDLDINLRHSFPEGVKAETVQYRGWKSLSNGDLLHVAQKEYDVLVTMDTNIEYQQHLEQFDIAVVVLRAESKRLPDLEVLMPQVNELLPTLQPGRLVEVFPLGPS